MYKLFAINGIAASTFAQNVIATFKGPFRPANWTLAHVAGSVGLGLIGQILNNESLRCGRTSFERKRSEAYVVPGTDPTLHAHNWVLTTTLYTVFHDGIGVVSQYLGVFTLYVNFQDFETDMELEELQNYVQEEHKPEPEPTVTPIFAKEEKVNTGKYFPEVNDLFKKVFGIDTSSYIAAGFQAKVGVPMDVYVHGYLEGAVRDKVMRELNFRVLEHLAQCEPETGCIKYVPRHIDPKTAVSDFNIIKLCEPDDVEFVIITNNIVFSHDDIPVLHLQTGICNFVYVLVALDKGKVAELTYRCLKDMETYEEANAGQEETVVGYVNYGFEFKRHGRICSIVKREETTED